MEALLEVLHCVLACGACKCACTCAFDVVLISCETTLVDDTSKNSIFVANE